MISLNNNLKRYALLTAGVTVAGVKVTKAQVRYTNLDPDQFLSNSSFFLDLDQDGRGDFRIENYQYFGYYYTNFYNYISSHRNTQFVQFSSFSDHADKIDSNIVIGSANTFTSGTGITLGSNFTPINYAWTGNETDKYLGVRIVIGGQNHFGWVRISTGASNQSMVIHDFAYNTIAGDSIKAGYTGQPDLTTNTGISVPTGGRRVLTTAMLNITDPDHIADSVKVKITTAPLNGHFENSDNMPSTTPITLFTQQNILDGKISYVHDGTATTADSITFSIQGGLSTPKTGNKLNITIFDNTSIAKNGDLTSSLSAFPNPTNGEITLNIDNDISGDVSLQVTNILGTLVFEQKYSKTSSSKNIALGLSSLESGVYLIRVFQGNKEGVLRILKN